MKKNFDKAIDNLEDLDIDDLDTITAGANLQDTRSPVKSQKPKSLFQYALRIPSVFNESIESSINDFKYASKNAFIVEAIREKLVKENLLK